MPRAPFANADPSARRHLLWLSGVAYLALWVVLIVLDGEIRDSGGPGIIPFEVAGSEDRAQEILDDWGQDGRDTARVSLIVDYPFLVAYALLLSLACTSVAQRLGDSFPRMARPGAVIALVPVAAAAFDAIENAALLRVLDGHTETWPAIALAAAVPKFALTTVAILYLLAGLALAWRTRRRAV